MKITISSSCGTGHSTWLAEEIDCRGYLDRFFISYYAQRNHRIEKMFRKNIEATKFVNPKRVSTNSIIFLIQKMVHKMNMGSNLLHLYEYYFFSSLFDRYVASKLSNTSDIIFAQSVMALHTMRRAKELGIITILDRPNSHVQYQAELMEAEYRSLGIKATFNIQAIIKKNIKEYEEADYIAVLSSFVKKSFMEKGIPEHKLLLVPLGISMNAFPQVTKEDGTFRVIFCGTSCVRKGVRYLLEAFQQLSLKDAELLLIGGVEKSFEPILEKYKGCYTRVSHIPHHQLYKYFSQGSVFVLPSLEEGLAKVIIEAMSCGLPVIATTNTGGEDVVREGKDGFIVPIRDTQALQEKILFLYEHQELCREMGQSAKERVREHFSREAYADRFIDACTAVQNKKRIKNNKL